LAALRTSSGFSQTLPEHPSIAFLAAGSQGTGARYFSGFPQGMRELGYVEGRDYTFIDRYAEGDQARLPLLAKELVRLTPDIIVTAPTIAVVAAKQATASIPIVGISMTDPVGLGLVVSEARPGMNVTGVLTRVEGMSGKWLEIVHDLIPAVRKIGVLFHSGDPSAVLQQRDIEVAATKIGLVLVPVGVRAADEVGAAFQTFVSEHAEAAIVFGDAMFLSVRRQIAASALASRLPTVFNFREHVEDGGLISLGIDLHDNFHRAAYFVDRILKGDKPADLPVEFPTKVELVINLKTAKALGLTIPPTLLARADDLIE
jgi:putative ABC transport system substrate-binding protein